MYTAFRQLQSAAAKNAAIFFGPVMSLIILADIKTFHLHKKKWGPWS